MPNSSVFPIRSRAAVALSLLAALVACEDTGRLDPSDGGQTSDAGSDAGLSIPDAGLDAGVVDTCFLDVMVGDGFVCALRRDRQVYCWGDNRSGQLGDGTTQARATPRPVLTTQGGAPLTGVLQIATGADFACARLEGGRVQCWGGNASGQLGPGHGSVRTPVPWVPSVGAAEVLDATEIAAGASYTCVLRAEATPYCVGLNNTGQLGDGTDADHVDAVAVLEGSTGQPFSGAEELDLGGFHGCGLRGPGVLCWGRDGYGRLGVGATQDLPSQAVEPALTGLDQDPVVDVSVGFGHSCVVRASGALECWGEIDDPRVFGGIGTVLQADLPTRIASPEAIALVHGPDSAQVCVITADRGLACMGRNTEGQLGDGTYVGRTVPVSVLAADGSPLSEVTAVSQSQLTTCAIAGDQVWCWGGNRSGQLGADTPATSPVPLRVDVPCE